MANTRPNLVGEFPDNTSGAISPADLRDFLDSVPLTSEITGASGITIATVSNVNGTRTTTISASGAKGATGPTGPQGATGPAGTEPFTRSGTTVKPSVTGDSFALTDQSGFTTGFSALNQSFNVAYVLPSVAGHVGCAPMQTSLVTTVTGLSATGSAAWIVGTGSGAANVIEVSADGGSTWTVVYPTAITTGTLSSVCAVGASGAWVTTSSGSTGAGAIWKTADGGNSWTQCSITGASTGALGCVQVVVDGTGTHGWAANGFNVLYTADGTNWSVQYTITNTGGASVSQIQAVSSSIVWALVPGEEGGLYYTTNGGSNWTPLGVEKPHSMFWVSATQGWVLAGTLASLLQTSNGGTSWTGPGHMPINGLLGPLINFVAGWDMGDVWTLSTENSDASDATPIMMKKVDGGAWTAELIPMTTTPTYAAMTGVNQGIIVGNGQKVRYGTNVPGQLQVDSNGNLSWATVPLTLSVGTGSNYGNGAPLVQFTQPSVVIVDGSALPVMAVSQRVLYDTGGNPVFYWGYTGAAQIDKPLGVSGKLTATSGANFNGLQIATGNSGAVALGLVAGDLYRSGADPDVVCVVH